MDNDTKSNSYLVGVGYALLAFATWGFLPLYWKQLKAIPAVEILAHRILWSFILVVLIIHYYGRWKDIKKVINKPSNRVYIILSSVFISTNWFVFIWAVNNNHVVETSFGYYITPLINVILGMLILRERLNFWQLIALLLAFIGVAIITQGYGKTPWLAIYLAVTFALYGLVKKMANLDSIIGLALETVLVAPAALVYIIYKQINGIGHFGTTSYNTTILLLLAGVATAMPLIWFAQGALRIPLSTLGFIQYIAPSTSLLLGIFIFKEPFTKTHLLSFGFIWCALLLYSFSGTKFMSNKQPNYFKESKCAE